MILWYNFWIIFDAAKYSLGIWRFIIFRTAVYLSVIQVQPGYQISFGIYIQIYNK